LFKKVFSLILVCSFLGFSQQVFAASESLSVTGKKTAIVAKAAGFGAGGGLIVGLASQVIKKKTKNIFLFGSLGLYTGIIMGLYLVTAPRGATPYEGPDTYEDYGSYQGSLTLPEREQMKLVYAQQNSADVSLYSFSF